MKHWSFSSFSFRKKVGVWLSLIALFIAILLLTTLSYFYPTTEGVIGLFVRFHFEAMVLIGIIGIGIGAASFYILSKELQASNQVVENQANLLLSFLTPLEKECVNYLLDNNGETYQSDLAKLPGMTRLKAHRITMRLQERKIVHVSSHGKANKITLVAEWKKVGPPVQ